MAGDGASIGTLYADIDPRVTNFWSKVMAQVRPGAGQFGTEVGNAAGKGIQDALAKGVVEGVKDGVKAASRQAVPAAAKSGQEVGEAFGKGAKGRIEAALKSLPDVKIDGDSSKLDKKIAAIRAELQTLGKADIADEASQARLAALRTQLSSLVREVQKLKEEGKDVPVNLDAFKAQGEIAALARELAAMKKEAAKPVKIPVEKPAPVSVPVKPDEPSLSKFEQILRRRVESAVKALPDIKLDADSSPADREIADIRAQLQGLSAARIGVDLDAAEATTKLRELNERLRELSTSSGNIQVSVDAAAAAAELAAVGAEVRKLAGSNPTINVDADTGAATAQLAAVGAASAVSGSGIQALIGAGIALGPAIVPAAAAAAAAIAAIGPAAIVGGAGIGVMALAFAPVIGAFKAADAAEDQAASSAVSSAGKYAQLASATDAVRSAKASLANTVANAADSMDRADQQVTDAEISLGRAQQDARRAQEDLTRAREDARRAIEDLNLSVADGALQQRQANLDVIRAKQELDKTLSNPATSKLQRDQAQLTYDQAVQHVEDLKVRQSRLVTDQKAANKAGIDGSKQVQSAQENVANTQEGVRKAVQTLANAEASRASQERQNAFAIAQAQQGVTNAQRSLQQATVSMATAGGSAADKLRQALEKLSPAGLVFYDFLQSLKPQFDVLSKVAQEGLFPGLQAGMAALLPLLPQISTFVGKVAGAFGDFFAVIGKGLATPFWSDFFKQIGDAAGPMLQNFATIVLKIAEAFGALLLAFLPLSEQMGTGLADMATKFAAFITAWTQSDGFTKFVDYVKTNGPLLLGMFGDIVVVAVNLAIALAPLGELIVRGLSALADWLAKLSPGQLIAVAAGIGAVVAAIVIAVGGPITAVVAGVTLVVGALVYAYTHWEKFRQVVDFVAKAYVAYVQTIIDVSLFLWQNAIKPAFDGISAVISFWWNNIVQPVFNAFAYVINNSVIPAVLFLWRNVIEPAWQGISVVISVAWASMQVIFGLMQIGLKILGTVFTALYELFIKPTWEGKILPLLRGVGSFIAEYVAPAWKGAIEALGVIFDGLREKIKAPIRFIIQTVLNDGLLGAYNWIASKFGVDPQNVHVTLPQGFATGGYITGPGGPTDDAILARLSAGEYVIPARVVSTLGVDFFNQLIGTGGARPRQYQGDGSEGLRLPGFADGGLVGWLKSAWNALSDPVGALKDRVAGLFGQIPLAGAMTDVVKGVGGKLLGGAVDFVRHAITNITSTDGAYTGPISADVASVQNWIRAQNGKPYIWAGAGPEGWDCSGFVGSVILALQGQNPYRRIFSTHNEAGFITKPAWSSPLTVGWANAGERGGGDVGHTAGNLAGLPFESGGALGNVHSGAGSTPVTSFAHIGSYDSGGWLLPGLTVARNDTGRPEAILTGPQWQALLDSKRGGTGTTITVPVYPRPDHSETEIAHQVAGELGWLMR